MKEVKLGMCLGPSMWFLTTKAKIAFVLRKSFRERYSKTLKKVILMSIKKRCVNPTSVKYNMIWDIDTSLFHFKVEGYVKAVKTKEYVRGKYKYKALLNNNRYNPSM